MKKVNVYYGRTNSYNSVIFDIPEKGYCVITEGDKNGFFDGVIDLCPHADDRTVEDICVALKAYFSEPDLIDIPDDSNTHYDYEDRDEFFDGYELFHICSLRN